jgi:hypothetical protein
MGLVRRWGGADRLHTHGGCRLSKLLQVNSRKGDFVSARSCARAILRTEGVRGTKYSAADERCLPVNRPLESWPLRNVARQGH